jgi:hypothetical protein
MRDRHLRLGHRGASVTRPLASKATPRRAEQQHQTLEQATGRLLIFVRYRAWQQRHR